MTLTEALPLSDLGYLGYRAKLSRADNAAARRLVDGAALGAQVLQQLREEITSMHTAALLSVAQRRGWLVDAMTLRSRVAQLGVAAAAKTLAPAPPSPLSPPRAASAAAPISGDRRNRFMQWTLSLFGRR